MCIYIYVHTHTHTYIYTHIIVFDVVDLELLFWLLISSPQIRFTGILPSTVGIQRWEYGL